MSEERPTPLYPGPWSDTPRWMFWKPTRRRISWKLLHDRMWLPRYEYQHPAFEAREILEKSFGK